MTKSTINIDQLLPKVDALFATMYAVRADLSRVPVKEHVATCIKYSDLMEMRREFVRELVDTAVTWVYSPTKQEKLIGELIKSRDQGGAWRHLWALVREKFRRSSVRGQFSELILASMLQYYYKATPLLRKMSITTNPEVERHGADAIHVGVDGAKYLLYIGEAKTYTRAGGGLRDGLGDALKGVVEKYNGHRDELSLYTYEDFLPVELEQVARDYQAGRMSNIEVHLVCMVTYNPGHDIVGSDQDELMACMVEGIKAEMADIKDSAIFNCIVPNLCPRMNYILFSVREMEDLLEAFALELGIPYVRPPQRVPTAKKVSKRLKRSNNGGGSNG